MRRFLLCLSALVLAGPIWADALAVDTNVSRVTVFPNGALITRQAFVDIPGGRHQIILREPADSFDDLPNIILPGGEGLRLISAEVLDINGVPAVSEDSDLYLSRLEDLKAAQNALSKFEEGDIALQADIAAAQTVLHAMESLAGPGGQLVGSEGAIDPEATMNLVTRMSVKSFEAQAKLDRAKLALEARHFERTDLVRNLEIAEMALDATDRNQAKLLTIKLTIEASRRVAGALRIESFAWDAGWAPSYRLDLDYEGMSGGLAITRQAELVQNSGLDWEDARVTLSTANPRASTSVDLPREDILRLIEQHYRGGISSAQKSSELDLAALSEPVVEAVIVDESGYSLRPVGAGEPVEYKLPEKITLASGSSDAMLVEIDQLDFPVDLFAQAIATRDKTAKLASLLNYDRGGILLGGETTIFHNGAYVGSGFLPEIASGDEAEIGLGPLKSVLIKNRIISREDGDRGLLTSSNARELRTDTEIVNLSVF